METRAAVLRGVGQEWSIETIRVDPPRAGEVLVEWKVAGLCHSDEHMVTGDMVPGQDLLDLAASITSSRSSAVTRAPVSWSRSVPGVTSVAPGDHVSASFVPSCGHCRYCASGRQNLCDNGAGTLLGGMITDGTHRHFAGDEAITMLAKLGTFSNHACVSEQSLIKVDPDLPLEAVALVSCGVATGWGSATKRADVRPGETVVVVGVGGIGMNAVQGARMAGAGKVIAIDPFEFKREKAMEFGATDTFSSMEEALLPLTEMTGGQMADKVIMTPGVMYGELMELGMTMTGKGGTCVVTAVAPMTQNESSINLFQLAMWNKEVKGTIFGSLNPRVDIPRLLGMYRDGQLMLDELITQRYPLDQINEGYQAMRDGTNIRGVVVY